MTTPQRCRCGWEGLMEGAPARFCPACGLPLELGTNEDSAAKTAADLSSTASITSQPESTGTSQTNSSAPAPTPPGESREKKSEVTRQAIDLLRLLTLNTWRFVREAFRFYWIHRPELAVGRRLWLTDYFPALQDPELLRREIRRPLAQDRDIQLDEGNERIWRIQLPERCIVCGSDEVGDWLDEERLVLDVYPMLVAPLVSAPLGLILGWWFWSAWLVVPATIAGFLMGYALRREERFVLRLKRCARHAETRQTPYLALFRRELILRPGTREVKMAFLKEPTEFAEPMPVPSAAPTDESPLPESIPLAEHVHESSIVQERSGKELLSDEEGTNREDSHPVI